MKNAKTTILGIVSALAGFVLFTPAHFAPLAVDAAKYVMLGGLAGLGVSARDAKT